MFWRHEEPPSWHERHQGTIIVGVIGVIVAISIRVCVAITIRWRPVELASGAEESRGQNTGVQGRTQAPNRRDGTQAPNRREAPFWQRPLAHVVAFLLRVFLGIDCIVPRRSATLRSTFRQNVVPRTFTGDEQNRPGARGESVVAWVRHLREAQTLSGVAKESADVRIAAAKLSLKGSAEEFANQYVGEVPEGELDFESFVAALITRFTHPNEEVEARRELMSLKMKDSETVHMLSDRYRRLVTQSKVDGGLDGSYNLFVDAPDDEVRKLVSVKESKNQEASLQPKAQHISLEQQLLKCQGECAQLREELSRAKTCSGTMGSLSDGIWTIAGSSEMLLGRKCLFVALKLRNACCTIRAVLCLLHFLLLMSVFVLEDIWFPRR